MNIKHFDNNNFNELVINGKGIVLVDFWAPWCGPCRMLAPIIEDIANEVSDDVVVGKLNIDENDKIAFNYQISAIPTVLIFKDGKLEKKLVGFRDKDFYINEINSLK